MLAAVIFQLVSIVRQKRSRPLTRRTNRPPRQQSELDISRTTLGSGAWRGGATSPTRVF